MGNINYKEIVSDQHKDILQNPCHYDKIAADKEFFCIFAKPTFFT